MISILLLLLHYDLTLFRFFFPNTPSANTLLGKILKPLTLTFFIYYQKYSLPPKPLKGARFNVSNMMIGLGVITSFISLVSYELIIRVLILKFFITMTFLYLFYCVASNWDKRNSKGFIFHVLISLTILISLIYRNIINKEHGMLVYTNEHYVKIALLGLSALSLIQFALKFVKSRTEYFEMNRNMEASINKRTELINQQKDELNSQREELIQQKNALQDQREEVRAQKELLQMKNNELGKISQVTNLSKNRISIFKPNGEIDWFNAAFARLINTELEDYKSGPAINIIDVSTTPESLREALSACIEHKEATSYESEEKPANGEGESVWMQTTLTPILDAQDNVSLVIAVDADITQLKRYEQKIEQQKAEAEAQRNIALLQRDEIEAKQNEIFGSIRYAKRIQTAMMPKPKQIQRDFSDSFVLFMPKDIVSGDFYWYHRIDNKHFIAARRSF